MTIGYSPAPPDVYTVNREGRLCGISIHPHSLKKRLGALLARHPDVRESHMGFPVNRRVRPIWKGQL